MSIANRAFGVELEVNFPRGASFASVAAAIRQAGVECYEENYGHSVPRCWKVVHDGSVPSGGEIVSPKLNGEDGVAQAVKVTKALQAFGCTVGIQTGFHLHVDASEFNGKELANTAINFLWFETFFDHIMPESRRGSTNHYVTSNRSKFGGYGTEALNAGIAAIKAADLSNPFKVTNAINPGCYCQREGVRSRCSCNARYCKMNTRAFNAQGSIEFRQHSGTVEAEKVEHWIRLMVAFVEKSKVSRPRPRKVIREWTAAQEMHLFFAMFNVGAETARYYMARRKQIAAQDKARREAQAAEQARQNAQLEEARRNAAGLGERATNALTARRGRLVEGSTSDNWRARNRARNAIRRIDSAMRSIAALVERGEGERLLTFCRDLTRLRILPVAALRGA
ncbi:MAG TPA: amidoligase family protein [Roseiarcus sp.]|nr:amidoligase family protein [Roseiarcus sp.]